MFDAKVIGTFVLAVLLLTAAKVGLKRNEVHGQHREPLVGAYVAVRTDDGRLYEMRTDRRGRFRLPLPILDDTTGFMVICARGHLPMMSRPSGAWSSGWGLQAGNRTFGESLREQGWAGPTPPECGDQTPGAVLWQREQARQRQCDRRAVPKEEPVSAAPAS